jgi:hypothetical protein
MFARIRGSGGQLFRAALLLRPFTPPGRSRSDGVARGVSMFFIEGVGGCPYESFFSFDKPSNIPYIIALLSQYVVPFDD